MKINSKLLMIIIFSASALAIAIYSLDLKRSAVSSSVDSEQTQGNSKLLAPITETPPPIMEQSPVPSPEVSPTVLNPEDLNLAAGPSSPDEAKAFQDALDKFYSSKDKKERESALTVVGSFEDPKAKDAILHALNDAETSVRLEAVNQISGWKNEQEYQQMLVAALSNDRSEVVLQGLEFVSEVDDPNLLAKIKELSNNTNQDISDSAKVALELIQQH